MKNRAVRHHRIRARITGSTNRPRLSVYRSNKNINVQLVDDSHGHTLLTVNDRALTGKNKIERAQAAGKKLAELAQKKGIKQVVFDRGGFLYHGRVAAVATGARAGGLIF